jgi:mycothiol synthase
MSSTLFNERPKGGRLGGGLALSSVTMWRTETRRELGDAEFKMVSVLLESAAYHDGFPPLSDHLMLDLAHRGGNGFAAVLAFDESDRFVGYAQLARANNSTAVELVVAPSGRVEFEPLAARLLRSAFEVVASEGGGTVNWWVHRPGDGADAVAAQVGLELGRRLLQMRRALPISQATTVETRAFVVGRDEAEWLRVNNAAFHDHPEQGGWTIETLRRREAEPWFDAAGFRLHERDGRLAAFCWTKVHIDTTPPMGEIYVIAVDPPFHGLGLGKALTVAGLAHLFAQGLTVGMLHVDAANTAGLSLYERLGFSIHHADHAYVGDIASTT